MYDPERFTCTCQHGFAPETKMIKEVVESREYDKLLVKYNHIHKLFINDFRDGLLGMESYADMQAANMDQVDSLGEIIKKLREELETLRNI